MNKWQVIYLTVLLAGATQTQVRAAQCPDVQVQVKNTSNYKVIGGIWGTTGNLGSSGFAVEPGQTTTVGVYSQDYPGGDFIVSGNVQMLYPVFVQANCIAKIDAALNGCPDPAGQPLSMTVVAASTTTVQCSLELHPITPPPPTPQIDSDGDNIPDTVDNCPNVWNPDQQDINDNHIGDACESAAGYDRGHRGHHGHRDR